MERRTSAQVIAKVRESRKSKHAYDLGDTTGVYTRGNILLSEKKVLRSLTPSKFTKSVVKSFLKQS